MLTFRFAGHLRRHFRKITLNVDTPAQGLRLLFAQCPQLKKEMLASRCRVRVSGDEVTDDSAMLQLNRAFPDGGTVTVAPVVEGSWVGAAVIIAVLSVAYSIYSARNMKNKTSAEAAESNTLTNNSFTSADNRTGQGRAIPILVGEMVAGSNVISLGIDTTNNMDWSESIS